MAAPTVFASAVSNPGGTGNTLTVTLSTHAVDDILLIYVANTGNALWAGNPAGWSRLDQHSVGNAGNGVIGTWLWRKVVSGDTLPLTDPVCTLGATSTRAAVCRTIRGADLEGVFTLPEWGARGFATGTGNPISPPTLTTVAPEMLVLHCYGQRSATDAPDPTDYTQDQEIVISGTLVLNASRRTITDQNTLLSNQDASPTSGARWAAGILCIPSPDYVYYRSGSQALTAAGSSATPALPTGTSSSDTSGRKDLIIATIETAGTPTIAPNTPADWTQIAGEWSSTTSGDGTTVRKYWALYDGTLDRQFNRSTSGEIFVYFSVYRNTHQTTPIRAFEAQQNASSTSGTWPALIRIATKSTVQLTCVADATPTYTTPAPWSERNDSQGVVCADQVFNATGTVASGSFTLSSASPTLAGALEVASVVSLIILTVIPATASVTTATFAPKLLVAITPPTVALSTTTFAPTITVSSSAVLTDDFNDNSRDTSKWTLGSIAFENAAVGVAEANQRVEITPLANDATPAIYGYRSANAYNFTGRQARVRIATSVAADTEAWLVVVLDANNYVRIWVAAGVLNTRVRVSPGTNTNQSHGAFSFATQNHWRIRHDNDTDEIVYEVGDGTGWTELRRIARPFSITSMDLYLSGGTGSSVADPAIVTFDDFVLNELTLTIPSTRSVSLTTFAPALEVGVTPLIQSLSLSTFPSVVITTAEVVITPSTASLTVSGLAPIIASTASVIPATQTLSLTGFAAQLAETTTPTTATVTATSFASSLHISIIPETESLTIATFAPTVAVGNNVTEVPITASLSLNLTAVLLSEEIPIPSQPLALTTFAPAITAANNITVIPAAATLTLSAFASSLATATIPVTSSLTLDLFTVGLKTATNPTTRSLSLSVTSAVLLETATPSTPDLALTAFDPQTIIHSRVTPATAELTLTTFSPQLDESVSVVPSSAILTLSSFALSLSETLTPDTRALTLAGFAPMVAVQGGIVPSSANFTTTRFAPSLETTLPLNTTGLTVSTFAPVATQAARLTPATQTLTISRLAPELVETVSLQSAQLTLTEFAPGASTGAENVVTPNPVTLITTLTAPAVAHYYPRRRKNIAAENRTIIVRSENRTVIVPAEN